MAAKKDLVLVVSVDDKGTPVVRKITGSVIKDLQNLDKKARAAGKGFDKLRKDVDDSGKGMSKFKGMLKSTMLQMAAGMGIMVGVQGAMRAITRTITDFIKTGREFEKEWANVTTMLSISEVETDRLKWGLINLSSTLGDVTELAKGMYQVLSASVDPAKAIEFLGLAAKAAVAGVTDVFTSVDALTTVINAYGMAVENATNISDIMFQTVKRGKLTFGELSSELGTVVPTAAQLGIRFEEIAAGMSTLTRQGINVNTVTMQLRQVMMSVLKPTSEAVELAKELGIEFTATGLKAKGMSKFLADISEKTKGDVTIMGEFFSNIRALSAVFGLAGKSAAAFAGDIELMGNAVGSTDEAVRKQMKTLDFWIRTGQNFAGRMKVAFYEGLVTPIRDTISTQEELDKSMKSAVGTSKRLGKVTTILGGILATALLPLIEREIKTIQGAEAQWSMAIELFTHGMVPAYSRLIKEKKELVRATIDEWKESKKLTGSQKKFFGPLADFTEAIVEQTTGVKNLIIAWSNQGMTIDEISKKLKKMMEEQENLMENTRILKVLEDLEVKSKTHLNLKYKVLTANILEALKSGKVYKFQLQEKAIEAAKLAEVIGVQLDPAIKKLTEKETLLMNILPKTTMRLATHTKVLQFLKKGFGEASTLIGGVFAPAVWDAIQATWTLAEKSRKLGVTLKTDLQGKVTELIAEWEKYKKILDPVEQASYVDAVIALMLRLGMAGVKAWKDIRKELEKTMKAMGIGLDPLESKFKQFLDKVRMYTSLVTSQMDATFNQLYQNQITRIDNEYQQRKKAIDAGAETDEEKYFAIEKLDREMEERRIAAMRKQASAAKITSLAVASINVAEAITKALTAGPIIGVILAGIIGALGAVQIAAIASQPLPGLAEGGIVRTEQTVRVAEKNIPEIISPLPSLLGIIKEAIRGALGGVGEGKEIHLHHTTVIGGTRFEDVVVKTVNARGDDINIPGTSVR